jgi:hypothetical protein
MEVENSGPPGCFGWQEIKRMSIAKRSRLCMALAVAAISVCVIPNAWKLYGRPLAADEHSALPEKVPIPLDTEPGGTMLRESTVCGSFVPLSMYFTTQDNPTYCGPASCSMVLNATHIARERWDGDKNDRFRLFTQKNLFTSAVRSVITEAMVQGEVAGPNGQSEPGMTLEILGKVLATFPLSVRLQYASERSLEHFIEDAVRVLKTHDTFLVVNYNRKLVGQDGGGHISPVAAYHEPTRRFLVLDVARYRYPPCWIEAERLFAAMRNEDAASGKSRGYVVVQGQGNDSPR